MTSIKIFSRIKPNLKNSNQTCLENEENNIFVKKIQKRCRKDDLVKMKYNFDKVFDEESINLDIYNYFSIDILKYLIKYKKDVTFYVYGQTGSGKTHTILGNEKEEGILGSILIDMLQINQNSPPITVSLVEIYNNKCYDLIDNHKQIYQRENGLNNIVLSSNQKVQIKKNSDIVDLKNKIINHRKVGVSSENDKSSRSHLLINIGIANKNLKILDLAGCEKAKHSICRSRENFKENGEINQSLFVLKECIRSLVNNKTYVPFRRSELTKMLRHSFDPSNKTYILATLSQDIESADTTVDVLNYVSDIKNIKTNNIVTKLPVINTKASCVAHAKASPRYNFLSQNKNLFKNLQEMEKKLLDEMIEKKSTKNVFEQYSSIVDKKQAIIRSYVGRLEPLLPPSKFLEKKKGSDNHIRYH